ncbi:hypothetical protein QTP86_013879, partial [Hemibagrus guttatus]
RVFSPVFLLAVYIPPEADRVTALGILHNIISRQETAHPDAAFIVAGDIEEYKKARYNLCKSIRKAMGDYSLRLEGYYTTAFSRRMWQGLQHITEYRQRSQGDITPKITLPDELNEFYARF